MTLQQRIQIVEQRIVEACARSGRHRHDVNVIAVTKYVDADTTEQALLAGLTDIGENRWQDAEEKWRRLGTTGSWHFIGHLQTNKVRDVVGKFTYIHSLDRLSLAQEINKKAKQLGIEANCFLQVNVSGEDTKHGLPPEMLMEFAGQVADLPHIRVVGLMTMAPFEAEPEETRPVFRGLRQLRDELNAANLFDYDIPHLSMGMSNDFEVAIEEGATWVRLGSVLVGK